MAERIVMTRSSLGPRHSVEALAFSVVLRLCIARSAALYLRRYVVRERTRPGLGITKALVTLPVVMATATTALAQGQDGCFYGSCNPEASWCRLLCGSDPQQQNVRSQWAPGYVGATHHRSMYLYVPPHGSSAHLHKKTPLKTGTNGGY